jgi:hypothetical protein
VLSLLVENNFEDAGVVVDLEHGTHRLLVLGNHATSNNNLNMVQCYIPIQLA